MTRPLVRTLSVVAGALFGVALPAAAAPALPAGSLYEEPFRWTDDSGVQVELSEFRGRPVILTMFYGNCSSICPVTLRKLREIDTAFEQRGITADFVLVSFDSTFDTPRALARFRERHKLPPDRWHLLAGPARSVRSFAKRIGLGDYVNQGDHIAHSFRILLLDEAGVARNALEPWHASVASLFEDGPAASRE